MNKWIKFSCLSFFLIACGGTTAPKHKPTHEVERIALNFIKKVKQGVYEKENYFFEADTEFTKEEREHYFRRLAKYIKNNDWNLHLTVVDIYEGYEDAANVILKAKSGDILILCLGYWYDTEEWELDAYEFPALTFNRPADQSYENYVKEIIKDIKDVGVEYSKRETIKDFGTYYIEYK